ncbi:FG-GAP repeat domain-containing protein [Streptomyces alanosinicus]|uniref:FG-GAP repeat domain-containing protein n=1 Tax=Streptomyces alanosinicus TaxID=68171 RepID=UPI001671BACC|nr:VCBS repeat-containing protein [Streptomyces alanosinicus]
MNSHVVKGAFALVLSGGLVGALPALSAEAAPASTAAGAASGAQTGAAEVATDPVQPGTWGASTELASSARHDVLSLQARADGALVVLRNQPQDPAQSMEVRRLTIQVRPAGSTTWAAPQTLSTASDYIHGSSTLAAQADGSFVAYWRERLPQGKVLLKAATLAPGATRWSDPSTVAATDWVDASPVVFGSATGRLTAVWVTQVTGARELHMAERPTPGSAWSEPTVFETVKSDEDGEWTLTGLSATVDKAGNAAIAWNLDDALREGGGIRATGTEVSYHSRIMERKAGAATWGEPEDLTPLAGTRPGALRLDADPAGGLTMLWASAGNGPLRFARKSAPGQAWTAPEETPLTGWYAPYGLPRPLTAPNGDVTLVDNTGNAVISTTRSARTGLWGAVEQADDRRPIGTSHASVSSGIASDGTVHAGWTVSLGNGSYRFVSAFRTRGGWSAPTTLADGTGNHTVSGALTVTGTRPTALWYDSDAGGGPLYAVNGTSRALPGVRDYGDDRRADVLSLTGTTLARYDGDAAGHLAKGSVHSGAMTTDWPAGTRFTGFGDLNGDRVNDVLAVLPTGEARMYETPAGRLPVPTSPYRKISADWRGYNVLTAPGDLTGDGRADLLARSAATGDVYLYAGNGSAGFAPRVRIRSGWKGYTRVIGAGDLGGDGRGDVLALDGSGELWRYNGTGTGKLADRVLVFRDWGKTYRQVLGAGDLNGDGKADLLSVDSDGVAWLNPGTGHGTFGGRVRVGSGWSGRTLS